MANPIIVTDATFEDEVLKSDVPVLNDFWADWCGPCKIIAPVLEEIADELDGQIKISKLDVDQNVQTAAKYGVRGIPTLILFKGGEEVERLVGAMPKEQLLLRVMPHLS